MVIMSSLLVDKLRCRAPGKCLLEWDGGPGGGKPPPVPLLKDMFGSERRKAKVLNFSIAYGKTAHGLARDWGTSLQEAEATVDRWYADRPEVRSACSAPVLKFRFRFGVGSGETLVRRSPGGARPRRSRLWPLQAAAQGRAEV